MDREEFAKEDKELKERIADKLKEVDEVFGDAEMLCKIPQEMKTTNLRAYKKDVERIKKFGKFGDSLADALSTALDLAEKCKGKE